MKYIKTSAKNAEKVKRNLVRQNLLDKRRKVKYSKSYVYFPIVISNSTNKKVGIPSQSYDILGNIAIIDMDGGKTREKKFARELLERHTNVTTILAKAGAVKGKYRTRAFRYVAGKKTFVANYRENNCVFTFDVRKTFFSNRLSFERARISKLVKEKENVVVFFSGVGPFVIEIAKAHKSATVVGIEYNKYASRMANENIKLNKASNAIAENGDVKKLSGKYKNFADRIIMPAPAQSMDFLDEAFLVAKKRAFVHFYTFGPNGSAFKDAISMIKKHSINKKYKTNIKFKRIVRSYSPQEVEVVIDYKIMKHSISRSN
jgi:tRNA (guanine37-N1)-methyltransferase